MSDQSASEKEHWGVDRKIPIALIITLSVQFVTGVWWLSALNNRVATMEDKNGKLELEVVKLRENGAEAKERFARTEATMLNVVETTRRVEAKLDRVLDDRGGPRLSGPRRTRKAGSYGRVMPI